MSYTDFIVISDFFSISALLTLAIYHLMIYFGRREFQEEKYNLYFALFSFSTAGYIGVGLSSYLDIFDGYLFNNNLTPPLEALFTIGIMIGFQKFLFPLVSLSREKLKLVRYTLIIFVIDLFLTLTCLINGYQWYLDNLFLVVVLIVALCVTFTFYIYGSFIVKQKLYYIKSIKLIISGIAILILYLVVTKILLAVDPGNQFARNSLIISLVTYLFAYALAVKFNNEHKELKILKEQLELKVSERTYELNKSKEKLERTNEEKTNYFVNLAHETKTPLTLIGNYLDKYIGITGNSKEIDIIKRNFDKLSRDMINFLDAEKLERGQVFYNHNQVVEISGFLNEKVELFQEMARKKNILMHTNIAEGLYVKADPYSIDRVLNNLVDNAIKYTGDSGVISVDLSANEQLIILTVKDTGIGIPPEQLKHIFEPYYQISHQKRNMLGIGMGLYIVKMIVDSLNAEIKVESQLNSGTKFYLTLNRYFADSNDSILSVKASVPEELPRYEPIITSKIVEGRKNLMILEDNPEMLNYLIDELSADYNIYPFINGEEALRKIQSLPLLDIILSDIMMDRLDGIAFFNFIMLDEKLCNIPFVFLTARKIDGEKVEMLNKGAIDFISKPFSIKELRAKLNSIIETKSKLRKSSFKEMIEILNSQLNEPINLKEDKRKVLENKCRQYGLTKRQEEIVLFISDGDEYKIIADKLNISHKTVIRHVQNLYETLHVHNKVELLKLLFD